MSDWTWYPQYQLYFSPTQKLWAKPDARTGAWEYVSAGETSSDGAAEVNKRELKTGHEFTPALKVKQSDEERAEAMLPGVKGSVNEAGSGTLEDVGWSFDIPGLSGETDQKADTAKKRKADTTGAYDTSFSTTGLNGDASLPVYRTQAAVPDQAHTTAPLASAILRLVIISTSIPASSGPAPTSTPASTAPIPSAGLPRPKVAIITATPTGVQIGRDKAYRPRIRLKELDVSKVHANVYWSEGEGKVPGWFVVDNGSTHGTFLLQPSQPKSAPPTRLSTPKHSSPPFHLLHLSRLTIGTTTFECHVHKDWPCEVCALGEDGESISTAPDSTEAEKEGAQSAMAQHLATLSGDISASSTSFRAHASPIILANPNGDWKETEARRVALTAQAKRDDTARRSKLAMKNLKASYFGGGGGGNANKGGKKRKNDDAEGGNEAIGTDNDSDGQVKKRKAFESGGNVEPLTRNRFEEST